jgi:hypothetical protein
MAVIGEAVTPRVCYVNLAPSKRKVWQNFRSWDLADFSKACLQQPMCTGQLSFAGWGIPVVEQNIRTLAVTTTATVCSRFTVQPGYL